MKKSDKWDDLTCETMNNKYSGDYITISIIGRFSMKAQTIYKYKDFSQATHVDVRYSKNQKALVFIFNNEEKGMKITFPKTNPKIVIFGNMYFFSRLELNYLIKETKKYGVEKEEIPSLGNALVLYLEKNTSKLIKDE